MTVEYRPVEDPIESISVSGAVTISDPVTVNTYTSFGVVTPSSEALETAPRALFFSSAGDVTLAMEDDTAVTITVVASQFLVGISPSKVTAWTGSAGAITWYS